MDQLKPFLTHDRIRELVKSLGERISKDYRSLVSSEDPLLVIVTLKGAALFAADLARELTVPATLDFVRVASYGSGTKSSGTVHILKDIEGPAEGKHLLVVDEIVDSGRTLNFLIDRLKASHPKTLRVASLLSKPSRREIPVNVDYLGMEVEDRFLVGYGLDFNERYRTLRDIYYIDNS